MVQLYLDTTDPYYKYITPDMVNAFLQDKREHIDLVNKFASRIGQSFPFHDADKFDSKYSIIHVLKNWSGFHEDDFDWTDEMQQLSIEAAEQHRLTSPHHPDYWSTCTFGLVDPENYHDYREPVEINYMSDQAIQEMCCDWCACSEQDGSSPFDWADDVIGTDWIVPDEIRNKIYSLLDELWNGWTTDTQAATNVCFALY